MTYDVTVDGKSYRLELERTEGRWSCRLDGRTVEVDAVLARPDVLSLRIGNRACEVNCDPPNPVSDAFHAALGFREIGRARIVERSKTVRYLILPLRED